MSEYGWDGSSTTREAKTDPQERAADGPSLTLSADDFSALEERIMRAVELVRRERLGRLAAEERTTRAETELREMVLLAEQTEKELSALRAERDHVRERVERLLEQLDALEL